MSYSLFFAAQRENSCISRKNFACFDTFLELVSEPFIRKFFLIFLKLLMIILYIYIFFFFCGDGVII